MLCDCLKKIATKSCFDPNAHVRILYRIAIVVIISPIPYCLVWFYAIISHFIFGFFSHSKLVQFVFVIRTSRRFIYSMCTFSWVFVGSCHSVVFFLFILLIFICFFFEVWTPVRFPLAYDSLCVCFFFVTTVKAIFLKMTHLFNGMYCIK